MKMNLMYTQVTHDIRFEDGPKITETKKKELLKNYQTDNIDKSLIRQIKRSFYDSDSNSSDTPQKIDSAMDDVSSVSTKYSNISPIIQDSSLIRINTNTPEITSELLKKRKEIQSFSPTNGKYKNILQDGMKKLVSGMSLFKKKTDISLSAVSSVHSINNMIETRSQEQNIVERLNTLENNVELIIDDNVNINSTKSAEEIFMEISKQCDTLTENFQFPEKKYEESIECLDIYDSVDNENIVESIMVEDENVKLNKSIEPDVKDVIDKIVKEIDDGNKSNYKEEVIKTKDENMSVITMESLHEEKKEEVVNKKKRTYKPRKKT
jgi:hypothetical protein